MRGGGDHCRRKGELKQSVGEKKVSGCQGGVGGLNSFIVKGGCSGEGTGTRNSKNPQTYKAKGAGRRSDEGKGVQIDRSSTGGSGKDEGTSTRPKGNVEKLRGGRGERGGTKPGWGSPRRSGGSNWVLRGIEKSRPRKVVHTTGGWVPESCWL